MDINFNKAIRMAVETGKVEFGSNGASAAALSGGAKMIIVAENCPKRLKADIEKYSKLSEVQVRTFGGSSIELGSLCGKPFPVAAMSVIEPGNSTLLETAKENKG